MIRIYVDQERQSGCPVRPYIEIDAATARRIVALVSAPVTNGAYAALEKLTCWKGNADDDGQHEVDVDLEGWQIDAILDAIKANKIPGVYAGHGSSCEVPADILTPDNYEYMLEGVRLIDGSIMRISKDGRKILVNGQSTKPIDLTEFEAVASEYNHRA